MHLAEGVGRTVGWLGGILLVGSPLVAQPKTRVPAPHRIDSLRQIDNYTWALDARPTRADAETGRTLWFKLMRFLSEDRFGGTSLLELLLYLVASFALIFVVFYVVRLRPTALFRRARTQEPEFLSPETEGVEAQSDELPDRLQRAEAAGAYRLAVRLQFLIALRQLTRAGILDYAPNRTNYDYLDQLGDKRREEFATLLGPYEQIWYGGYEPDAKEYQRLAVKFAQIRTAWAAGEEVPRAH